MKPKILKLQVSELSPEEMKKVSVYGDETPEPPKSDGCYATAQCLDGSHVSCLTHISGADCKVLYAGMEGDLGVKGVMCAGVVVSCPDNIDSGSSGSGGDQPTPPTINPTGKL